MYYSTTCENNCSSSSKNVSATSSVNFKIIKSADKNISQTDQENGVLQTDQEKSMVKTDEKKSVLETGQEKNVLQTNQDKNLQSTKLSSSSRKIAMILIDSDEDDIEVSNSIN